LETLTYNGATQQVGGNASSVLFVFGSGQLAMFVSLYDRTSNQLLASGSVPTFTAGGSDCGTSTSIPATLTANSGTSVNSGDVIVLNIDATFSGGGSVALCSGGNTPTMVQVAATPGIASTTTTSRSTSTSSSIPSTSSGQQGLDIWVGSLIAAGVLGSIALLWYKDIFPFSGVPKVPPGAPKTVEKQPPPLPPPKDPTQHDVGGIIQQDVPACVQSTTWGHSLTQVSVYPAAYTFRERKRGEWDRFYSMYETSVKDGVLRQPRPGFEPLILMAYATDEHFLTHECRCGDSVSRRSYSLYSRVSYEWDLVSGRGNFVVNSGKEPGYTKQASGEQAIYYPPDLDLGEEVSADVVLKVLHNDRKLPGHRGIRVNLHITTKIEEVRDGMYLPAHVFVFYVSLSGDIVERGADPKPDLDGACTPTIRWLPGSPISGGMNLMPLGRPNVAEPYALYSLSASGEDQDELQLQCVSSGGPCASGVLDSSLEDDDLVFEWESSRGAFPRGNLGRVVVWQSPGEGEVTFTLTIRNQMVRPQFVDEPKVVTKTISVVPLLPNGGAGPRTERKKPPVPGPPPPKQTDGNPPTIHGETQVTCCGPDVTDHTLGCMLKLITDFFLMPDKYQKKELDSLTSFGSPGSVVRRMTRQEDDEITFEDAWDILELAPSEERGEKKTNAKGGPMAEDELYKVAQEGYRVLLRPYRGRCLKPSEPCDPSVVFLNNCHHPQVVNYLMWGVLSRLNEWWSYGHMPQEARISKAVGAESKSYSDTQLSNWHYARSGSSFHFDANYQDQVAMASVGWRLADDYVQRKVYGKLPYKLAEVNKYVLQAILESLQNPTRRSAPCLNGCGPHRSLNSFRYRWGNLKGQGVPLSKL
jgi:hypothetical protein